MKKEVYSDALVTFEDARRWVEPLMKEDADELITRMLAVEPAVLGVAIHIAKRTCARIAERGSPEVRNPYIFEQICRAGAIAIALMRQGNAKLWDDFIEPSEDGTKETNS